MNILVTQPVHDEVLTRLRQIGQVDMNPGPSPWTREQIEQRLPQADAMLAFMTDRVDAALLAHAPRLRVIACALKGYDNFDLVAIARAGIELSFVPDLLTEPTAELAIGLAIAAARHMRAGDEWVRGGHFDGWRPMLYGTGLHGACVAVVGLGLVGRAILDRLQGFACSRLLGVDAQQHDPRTVASTFDEALRKADYLFLAVPLSAQTRGMYDMEAAAASKPGQILINVGRGSVVDEAAVAHALKGGRLGAYAADVFEMEDWHLPERPNAVHPDLLQSPRTILTPHLGSAVARVRLAIEHRAVDNLVASLAGVCPSDALAGLAA